MVQHLQNMHHSFTWVTLYLTCLSCCFWNLPINIQFESYSYSLKHLARHICVKVTVYVNIILLSQEWWYMFSNRAILWLSSSKEATCVWGRGGLPRTVFSKLLTSMATSPVIPDSVIFHLSDHPWSLTCLHTWFIQALPDTLLASFNISLAIVLSDLPTFSYDPQPVFYHCLLALASLDLFVVSAFFSIGDCLILYCFVWRVCLEVLLPEPKPKSVSICWIYYAEKQTDQLKRIN